jgi:cobalt/nickel transport system permease protein
VKHSFIDRYSALYSPLHLLDARSKILGFTALIVAVLSIPPGQPFVFFAHFFLAAVLMGLSQVPLAFVVGRTLLMLPFVLMAGIALPWRSPAGMELFVRLVLRSLLCLLLLVLMTNTTRFGEMLRGMRKLGFPRIIVMNLGFLYRYVFILTEEVLRTRMARECRQVGRSPWRAELRLLGSMLGSILIRSFERAERMYQAMLSRGGSADYPVFSPQRFSWGDLVFLAGVAAFVAGTQGMARGWFG